MNESTRNHKIGLNIDNLIQVHIFINLCTNKSSHDYERIHFGFRFFRIELLYYLNYRKYIYFDILM